MRAAIVAWRYQTTTRRARSAATAHAIDDSKRPTIGSGPQASDESTLATKVGATHSVSSASRGPSALDGRHQAARAAMRTRVAVQSAATFSARMPASRRTLAPFQG